MTLILLAVVIKRENNSKFQRKFADFLKIKQRNFVFGGGHIINYYIIKFYTNLFFKELYYGKLTFLKLNLKKSSQTLIIIFI